MKQALTSGLMVWVVMVMGTTLATASDTAASEPIEPPPVSEASRLDEVRALVRDMPPIALVSGYAPSENISRTAFCRRLLMDLSEEGAFVPLEPFAVLNQPYPLTNPTASTLSASAELAADRISARVLGASVTRRVNYCFTDSPNDRTRFDGFNALVGAPPYRVYALPQALRTPRHTALIYWSERDEALKSGRDSYAVVDLSDCVHRGGLGSLTGYWIRDSDRSSFRSTLVMRGQSVVAWDVAPGTAVLAEVLGRGPESRWHPKGLCRWMAESGEPVTR